MVGPSAERPAMSGERGIEQFVVHFASAKTLSAFDRRDDNLGRAEQHGIDGVEVAFETLEDLGKRSAEIAGRAAGKRLREILAFFPRPGDIKLAAPPEEDRSLGRPIGLTKSGGGGLNGAAPMPSTMCSSGNFSSWALCNATSSTRATTCVVPAKL